MPTHPFSAPAPLLDQLAYPLRILGIDPGLATMGYGCLEVQSSGSLHPLDYGVISTSAQDPTPKRLQTLHQDLTELLATLQPHRVAVEKLFFYKMGNTIQVAQARGVILLALAEANLIPHEYAPPQIKLSLTGYGRADKVAIQQAITQELNLDGIPRPDDAADGLAIALTHWHYRHEWNSKKP
ncbi:MAG: crossover junction endodeoxyribonuclease RuvC [Cyanophyceae cyanobacterium]